jgi:hypothetical protein
MKFGIPLVEVVGHYATSRNVAGSSPNDLNFFQLT